MLAGALETYAAALIVVAASTAIGAGIVAACGRREWSWTAPAVGLAAATVIAWWAVRLRDEGEGVTALLCLAAAAAAGAWFAVTRLQDVREAASRGVPVLLLVLLIASVPFVAEGHFGVLGTGFNVDMSQHLFAADWLSDPAGAAPGLYEQGYPLGPHALAVATGEVGGELANAFSGVTIAVAVLLALTALGACDGLSLTRASGVALLSGFAYLAATYFAQGSFKELFAAVFLVGFALLLAEVGRRGEAGWRAGVPLGVLAAGSLYAYSGPGIAWLAGTAVVWAGIELLRRGDRPAMQVLGRGLPAAGAGMLVALALAVPELDRIIDFGGSVGTVSERAETTPPKANGRHLQSLTRQMSASRGGSDAVGDESGGRREEPEFDDDLGNLFGQISPLEVFGVWPSGDFRVAPGDGAVPAVVFYAGALLGAIALAFGIAAAARRSETALLAALAAAAAIWLAARIGSTPYTTAKALMMVAPVGMMISARGLLDPELLDGPRRVLRGAFAAAFVAGAGVSTALVLVNAPVGPREYTPGVTELSDRFAGRSVLLLVDDEVLADQRGQEFYGWELRRASEFAIEPESARGGPAPAGVDLVIGFGRPAEPPFDDLAEVGYDAGATIWRVTRQP